MLDYGINFNVEEGAKKAQKELEEWNKKWQDILKNNPLKVDFSGVNFDDLVKNTNDFSSRLSTIEDQTSRLQKDLPNIRLGDGIKEDGRSAVDVFNQLKHQAGEYGGIQQQMATKSDKATESIKKQNATLKRQSDIMVQLKSYAMNFLSVYAGIRLTKNMVAITGEFEAQRMSLQAILRDAEQGEAIFNRIKGLAVESPFMFKDLVSFTKQLSAFSVPYEELYDTTKMLADVSAGLGVEMSRIILAYGQVRSAAVLRGQELRQFTEAGIPLVDELAKKFTELKGEVVSASDVFDLISQRQVPFEMIKDILTEMTSEGGKFYQMQEKLADTLKGKVANLTDAFQIMLAEIGEKGDGVLKGSIDSTRWLIENYEKAGRILLTLASTYGGYRAAVALTTTAELFLNGTYVAKIRLLRLAVATQNLLNKAMLANPYVIAGAALAGLITYVYLYKKGVDAAASATENWNNLIDKQKDAAEKEKSKISELINTIKDETATRVQKETALKDLQDIMPSVFNDMDVEAVKLVNLTELMKAYNLSAEERNHILRKQAVEEGRSLLNEKEGAWRWSMADRKKALELMGKPSSHFAIVSTPVNDLIEEFSEWVKQGEKSVKDFENVLEDIAGDPIKYDTFQGLIKALSEAEAKLKDLQDQAREGIIPTEDVKAQQEVINKLKENLSLMGWEEPKKAKDASYAQENAMIKAEERLNELRAKMALEEKKYALEVRQVEIDAMEDGTTKELAQIELTKDKDLQAIEERKQAMIKANLDIARARWESEGKPGDVFIAENYKEELALSESQISALESMKASADLKEMRSKELMFENLLNQYKDYAQKVKDIEKKKVQDIKNLNEGRTSDNSDLIDRAISEVEKKAKEETASLAFDEIKNSEAWRVLFSDLENYTVKTLKRSLEEVSKADISNLNPADAKAVQQAIDKMRRKIDEKNPFFALKDGWEQFIKATKESPDDALEAINRMIKGAQDLLGYFGEFQNFMGSAFGAESDTSFWTNTMGDFLTSNVQTGGGMAKILMGDLTGVKDVIKGVTGYVNIFKNIRNRKYNKEIERQQKIIDGLTKEYEKLDKAIKKTVGNDNYKASQQQAKNLEAQAAAVQRQLEAERKKGKDKDEERIKQLEQQYASLLDQRDEVVSGITESIAGTDLVSAARDFAQAWLDAYISFGSTTDAIRNKFKEMTENMVVDAVLSAITMKYLEPIFDMIDKRAKDGELSSKDISDIFKLMDSTIDKIDSSMTTAAEELEKRGIDLRNKETNLTGISKGISSITEDTALILGGYLNSIRDKLFPYIDYMMAEHRTTMSDMLITQRSMAAYLVAIEGNTKRTAESNDKLLDRIDRVFVASDSGKGFAINVNA